MNYQELTKKFDWVSDLFKQEWTRHPSVPDEPVASVDRMFVHHFDQDIYSEEVIAEAEKMGARVATAEELVAYAEKYPDEQRKYWIVGLGSSAMGGGCACVAVLLCFVRRRILAYYWFDFEWFAGDRFLFVRKQHLDTGKLGTSEPGELDTWTEEEKDAYDKYVMALLANDSFYSTWVNNIENPNDFDVFVDRVAADQVILWRKRFH